MAFLGGLALWVGKLLEVYGLIGFLSAAVGWLLIVGKVVTYEVFLTFFLHYPFYSALDSEAVGDLCVNGCAGQGSSLKILSWLYSHHILTDLAPHLSNISVEVIKTLNFLEVLPIPGSEGQSNTSQF